jgi:hypothetical protein
MMLSRYPLEFPLHLASIALALAAALYAVYLIPLAGKARAWVLFAAACVLLVVNRVLETLNYTGLLPQSLNFEVADDVLDVVTAGCLFLGVFFIRAIFVERRESRLKLERQLDELRRFQQLSIGRELRMKALYEENQTLKARLGERNG